MTAGLVWDPLTPDGVREVVAAAAGGVVTVTSGDQRCIGTLSVGPDRLMFEVAECTAGMESSDLARVDFDLGRFSVRLWVRLDEASGSGWVLHWPESAERRDRRRFERVEGPGDQFRLALADREPTQGVDLVDVSVNGASFVGPPGRVFLRGQRIPATVVLEGLAPAPVLLEILSVDPAADEGSVVRGRFLAPEDGSELDLADLGASVGLLDELSRILGAVAADSTPAGVLRAFVSR